MMGAAVTSSAVCDLSQCDELQTDSTNGPQLIHLVTASYANPPKKSTKLSPPIWDIAEHPFTKLYHQSCSVEFLPTVPEVPADASVTSSEGPSSQPPSNPTPQCDEHELTTSLRNSKSLDIYSSNTSDTAALLNTGYFPIRRTNSAPELSTMVSSSDDDDGPPEELLQRRRGSLQEFGDVFLDYVPYVAGAVAPATIFIHLAFDFAKRISSS